MTLGKILFNNLKKLFEEENIERNWDKCGGIPQAPNCSPLAWTLGKTEKLAVAQGWTTPLWEWKEFPL